MTGFTALGMTLARNVGLSDHRTIGLGLETIGMHKTRDSLEVIALKTIFPALLFAAVWLNFSETASHLAVGRVYSYIVLVVVAGATWYRIGVASRRPNARILRFFPVFDCAALGLLRQVHGWGGQRSLAVLLLPAYSRSDGPQAADD